VVRVTRVVRIAALALVLLAACGSNDDTSSAGKDATTVKEGRPEDKGIEATLKEFSITLAPAEATAGEVHFELKNVGAIEHEFVVFKTDLDPAKLPVDADGNVDEEGAGVEHIGEQEHVKPKTPMDFSISLDAGSYVVVCNLPAHYKAGMHAALTVS
jgi:uncharacterized cupredoxin-like copper-binding protein